MLRVLLFFAGVHIRREVSGKTPVGENKKLEICFIFTNPPKDEKKRKKKDWSRVLIKDVRRHHFHPLTDSNFCLDMP